MREIKLNIIEQLNREYAEKQLVDTENKKIEEVDKWKKANDFDTQWDWLKHICYGIKEDLENKPREFWN